MAEKMTEAQKNEKIEAVENGIEAINVQVQTLGIEDAYEMAQELLSCLMVLKEGIDWDEEQEEVIDKHIGVMQMIKIINERSNKRVIYKRTTFSIIDWIKKAFK